MAEQHFLPQHVAKNDENAVNFFQDSDQPSNFEDIKLQVKQFVEKHASQNKKIVLVTVR
jgi:hypothetical protein